jgi:uncharacterized protein YndB with AHSA1/START domain
MSETTKGIDQIRLDVRIEAPRERVWRALTDDLSGWWPADTFNVGGASVPMRFEAKVGGRMYEDWGDGQGLLWAQVVLLRRPEQLSLIGDSFPEWGGPARSYLSWTLEADGAATVVHFVDSQLGERRDQADKEKGWAFLIAGCLKSHLEGRPQPAWEA